MCRGYGVSGQETHFHQTPGIVFGQIEFGEDTGLTTLEFGQIYERWGVSYSPLLGS